MEENKEKKMQETYMEFQVIEQNIRQVQRQLEMITNQLIELTVTSNSLDEFKKISTSKEVFVPLSSGIFAKASINDTSELLVNVGANVAVKKGVESTKKLIQDQLEEVKKIQKQMVSELDNLTHYAASLENQLQGLMPEK